MSGVRKENGGPETGDGGLARLGARIVAAAMLWVALGGVGVAGERVDAFVFGERPRLKYAFPEAFAPDAPAAGSAAALARWAGVIASAEKMVAEPAEVPKEGGQWIFYYACPADNVSLKLKDGKHVCPKCGKAYDDERTRLAYVTSRHYALDNAVLTLGQAWHVSRREEFAREAFRILTRYAELYPGWERHDRWGRTGLLAVIGGKRYCQSLDEAVGIIKVAKAWDLLGTWAGATAAARERIERDFLRGTVETIYSHYALYDGRNNHMTWFNAAAATVGAALGDAGMVNRAVNGSKGLRSQFAGSVTAEGLWYEGTISYHFYALEAIVATAQAARACGVDLTGEAAFRRMYQAPLELAWPNGRLPAFNDGDPGEIKSRRGAYAFAAQTWDDPALKRFAENGALPVLESALYRDAGLAYLRRGKGEAAVSAILDYGQHGGHHGHPDKLNLLLYAFGQEVFFDPGRLTYSCPEHTTWSRQTVAHNTVVIDRASQAPVDGTLINFVRGEGWDAVVAEAANVYPHARLRRALVLFDDALVDFFLVRATRRVTMDWVLHGLSAATTPEGFAPMAGPMFKEAGYQHLTDLARRGEVREMTLNWPLPGGKSVRSRLFTDAPATAVFGKGIGYQLTDRAPFVMLTREGEGAAFAAVYDLTADGSVAASAAVRFEAGGEMAAEFARKGGKVRVRWSGEAVGVTEQ